MSEENIASPTPMDDEAELKEQFEVAQLLKVELGHEKGARYFCIAANWVNEKIDEEKFDAMVKELPVSNEQFELHKQFKNGVKTALEETATGDDARILPGFMSVKEKIRRRLFHGAFNNLLYWADDRAASVMTQHTADVMKSIIESAMKVKEYRLKNGGDAPLEYGRKRKHKQAPKDVLTLDDLVIATQIDTHCLDPNMRQCVASALRDRMSGKFC